MASGASQPGLNQLLINDSVSAAGAVGITIGGEVEIDFIVSQGCRPIGTPLVVTKSKANVLQELGGQRALDVLQALANDLPQREKALLKQGLLLGSVIDEYKDHFGRGDFLVRNILGFDKRGGGIAVGEIPRVGQTIQFHVRDAETADEDLQLLLDAQQLKKPPFAALLFSCNGRGKRLFKEPNHDIGVIRDRLGDVPIAGFFAAGEIGPIGEKAFLHGPTAGLCALVLCVFSPNLIAHGRLVTFDLGLACFSTMALYHLWRFSRTSAWRHAMLAGLGLGLTLASKFSGVLLLAPFVLLPGLAGSSPGRRPGPARRSPQAIPTIPASARTMAASVRPRGRSRRNIIDSAAEKTGCVDTRTVLAAIEV